MYSIYIKSKDIDKIKLCEKETFSMIKVNDSINIRFQDLDHFESCRKKIYNSLKGSEKVAIQPCANNQQATSLK
jgi:hypothetical protein